MAAREHKSRDIVRRSYRRQAVYVRRSYKTERGETRLEKKTL